MTHPLNIVAEVDPDRLLRPLDAAQRAAVISDAAPLAIVATAGSGKTRVLTTRIAHRIATGRADASHVVALTFTRDAAAELRSRLRRLEIREPILAGTFHAVALRLLRDHALTRNVAPPAVAPDRLRLLRECVAELRLAASPSGAAADLDWARARMVPAEGYGHAVRQARRKSNVPANRFADLTEAYARLKKRRGVVDFDDILATTLRTAQTDHAFAALVQWRFRHFFVDEAQDLNPLQFALLESWRAGRPDICLVGDPRQAIFGWNGADPATLDEVEVRLPAITVVTLTANHRCTPQVVRAGTAALVAAQLADDTVSARADGPPITVRVASDERAEAVLIADHVRALLATRSANDVAVLARTNEQLDLLDGALAAARVPVARSAGRSPLEVAIADALRQRSRDALAAWADAAADGAPTDESSASVSGTAAAAVRRRVALEAIRFLAADRGGTFRAWIDEHSPFDDVDPGSAEPAVDVVTFHAAKGREWPVVIVAGLEAGLVPHASAVAPAQVAEEVRLLYVAITRAGECLLLTRAERRKGAPSTASPWLDGVARTAEADRPVPPPARRPPPPPDPLDALRGWRAKVARAAGVVDNAVCSDRVLRSLRDDPPADHTELARRLGISRSAAQRLTPLPADA